jgi:flavodoxin
MIRIGIVNYRYRITSFEVGMKAEKAKSKSRWIKVMVIFVCIAAFTAAMVVCVNAGQSLIKKTYGDCGELLKGTADAKKALIVYQPSITKATEEAAHSLARGLNDSGYEVVLNSPGGHLSGDISGYSIIAFGFPVYGSTVPEALKTYIGRVGDLSGKRILLFSTAGFSDKPGAEYGQILELLNAQPYANAKWVCTDKEKISAEAYELGLNAAKD